MSPLIPGLTAGFILFTIILIFFKPLLSLLRLAVRSSIALLLLTWLQNTGTFLGITLGINLWNALILGLLGIPGLGLLLLIQWLLKT